MIGAYDESHFMFTDAAWIIPTISGSISAVSSSLIMSVILRSSAESRFSSYHIIMLFTSFWDAIASTGIALTTIPMPSDVYEVYPFQGKAFGNIGTCGAQGFLIQLGTFCAFAAQCCLNIYYVCTIRYNMSEDRMKKKVLPKMVILCMIFALPGPVQALMKGFYNPHPLLSYCGRCSYPYFCNILGEEGESFECIRGLSLFPDGRFKMTVAVVLGASFLILLSSLVLVVATAIETEISLRRSRRIRRGRGRRVSTRSTRTTRAVANSTDESEVTRVLLTQACLYIAAFVLTWVWFLVVAIETQRNAYFISGRNFMIARSIFRPLQGFFNAIIFIYQKVYLLRRANSRLGFMGAIFQAIKSPRTIPVMLISGMDVAREEDGGRRPSSNTIVRRGELSSSRIDLVGANATNGDNNSNDSDGSNVDASSVAAQSDHDLDLSSLSAAGYSSTGTSKLATVQEESDDGNDSEDNPLDNENEDHGDGAADRPLDNENDDGGESE